MKNVGFSTQSGPLIHNRRERVKRAVDGTALRNSPPEQTGWPGRLRFRRQGGVSEKALASPAERRSLQMLGRSERRTVPTALRSGGISQANLEGFGGMKDLRFQSEIPET